VTIITLTTDFGTIDSYVGTMKGVILGIAPEVTLVDISHEIPPQNVRGGAFVLGSACPYFPLGSIHVVVVDPGVGSKRRILAARTRRATYVGPDNGVLSWALERETVQSIISVTESKYWLEEISGTFHGRDIFAPVAAHLARGVPIEQLGSPATDLVQLPVPLPRQGADGSVHSEVIYIDRFGNLVTAIRIHTEDHRIVNLSDGNEEVHLGQRTRTEILGQHTDSVRHNYADIVPGELVALVGSSGHLELAVRDGSAATVLKGYIGAPVRVVP
jgi:S-adenosylmethionine hydrolase